MFQKTFFAPKIGKMRQKQGFLNLLNNLVINFYWICSIMKIYTICCVPGQIPYLGNFLSLGDMCQSVHSQSDCRLSQISQPFLQNKSMKHPHFLHADTNSQKLKVDLKSGFWTLKLIVSEEGDDGIN